MATKKQGSSQGGGSARIRFVMLEADVDNGNLSEFANTIANALKSSTYQKALAPVSNGHAKEPAAASGETVEASAEDAHEETEGEAQTSASTAAGPKTGKPKKWVSKPNVLDLDLTSGDKPLKDFLTEKAPDNFNAKYLAIAAWLKEYRKLDTITIDHVFTCFKSVGWGFGSMGDISGPLRDLKKQSKGEMKDGKFTINHIGVGLVNEMTSGG